MKQDMLAPWAEPVPDAPFPITGEQMLAMPDDGWQYEIAEGRLVRMPGSRSGDSRVAVRLVVALSLFVEPHNLGCITGADGIYNLTQPGETRETQLSPDAAFVAAGRYPPEDSPDYNTIWHLAPDLVAEVVSPHQYRPEMAAKARRYLAAGVRLVWVIWPKSRQVDVWLPGASEPARTLGLGDALDGLEVLPGFRHPVAALFPGALANP